jgi:hypothetical protein
MMKKLLYLLAAIVLQGAAFTLQAQSISMRMNGTYLRGRALTIDMDARFPYVAVDRYQSLRWTFILRENAAKGKRRRMLRLPSIIMDGANKRQMYERTLTFQGKEAAKRGAYAVLKSDPALIQFLLYRQRVRYQPWMSNCQLLLVQEVLDYNDKLLESNIKILQKRLAIRRR